MPTYEYRCDSCGHLFEKFQTMKDDPLKDCPSCGAPALQRLIGAGAGLLFKGTGFYLTDYRKSATQPASASSSSTSEKKETHSSSSNSASSAPSSSTPPAASEKS
ncbi:MAG: zinc ribbon domain-containing protein [Ignavibacteriae bacterium]|nr:zinc ribbon domain-containing protein [Ignavibacteriota bacterium]